LVWKLKELKAITKHLGKELQHQGNITSGEDGGRNKSPLFKLFWEDEITRGGKTSKKPRTRKEHGYLKEKEELWRQRSRAIWIQSGDQNTKFFHHFANYRRNCKYVWEIRDD
jgi:hypothetical protein